MHQTLMARLRTHIPCLFILILVLLCIAIGIVVFTFDLNRYRAQVEQELQQALGADIKIEGDLNLSLQLTSVIEIEGLKIQDRGADIASIKKASLSFPLLSLLQGDVQLDKITIKQGTFRLLPDHWPFPNDKLGPPPASSDGSPVWKHIPGSVYEVIQSNISYEHEDSPRHIVINDLNMTISATKMHLPTANGNSFTNTTFHGQLQAARISTIWVELDKVSSTISYDNHLLELTGISSRLFQGEGHGDFFVRLDTEKTNYQLNLKLEEMEAAVSLSRLANEGLIKGTLSLYADLSWQGNNSKEILNSLHGDINLSGEELLLKNINLDKTINNFNQTQRFNLVDLGAYFFIGPMGTLATKGYSFAKITTSSDTQSSIIKQLVSDWKLKNGIATAEDVALTTRQNRLALQGKLDIPNSLFQQMVFALVDRNGCAILSQRISGSLENPNIEPPKILTTLTAPVRDVMSAPKKLLSPKRCTAFYSGRLTHPGTVR
ncbi:MAG: AsmA family protein [Gammaproteobacteria bacterium]|nr:AsmA family protein [Gammaproteobacteria bacterium]